MLRKFFRSANQRFTLLSESPALSAFVLALVFGVFSAVMVPQMLANDETAHFLKTYSVSTGKFGGTRCIFPEGILDRASIISKDSFSNDYSTPIDYTDTVATTCGSAQGYSPIMHLPMVVGVLTVRPFHSSASTTVLVARLCGAIFYAISLYAIVRFVRVAKWTFVIVGLFPTIIHAAGTISGDTVNNVVVMGMIALTINLATQVNALTRRQVAQLLVASTLVAMTKITNVVLLLLLLALPTQLFKNTATKFRSIRARKTFMIGLCFLIGLFSVAITYKLFGASLVEKTGVENPLIHHPEKILHILYNTYINPSIGYGDLLVRGVVGEFASFRYHLPTILVFSQFVIVIMSIIHKQTIIPEPMKPRLKSLATISSAVFLLLVFSVTVALYSTWSILPKRLGVSAIYADGVQGRYFSAATLLLVPLLLFLKKYIWLNTAPRLRASKVFLVVISTNLAFYAFETFTTFY